MTTPTALGSRQAPTKALLGLALAEYRVLLNSHYFHRDIISGGFGIGAQLVCPIDKLLSGFFINIWHGNPEFYRKTKALAFFANTDFAIDHRFRGIDALLFTSQSQSAMETGTIADSK